MKFKKIVALSSALLVASMSLVGCSNKTNNDESYYIPVTKYVNSKDDKIKIIIDEKIFPSILSAFYSSNVHGFMP